MGLAGAAGSEQPICDPQDDRGHVFYLPLPNYNAARPLTAGEMVRAAVRDLGMPHAVDLAAGSNAAAIAALRTGIRASNNPVHYEAEAGAVAPALDNLSSTIGVEVTDLPGHGAGTFAHIVGAP